MRLIEVKEGQNQFDLALQYFGSAEGVIKLLEDNLDISLDTILIAGQGLIIAQEPDKPEIVNYYSKFNHTVIGGVITHTFPEIPE